MLSDRIQNEDIGFRFGAIKTTPTPTQQNEVQNSIFLRKIHLAEKYVFRMLVNSINHYYMSSIPADFTNQYFCLSGGLDR